MQQDGALTGVQSLPPACIFLQTPGGQNGGQALATPVPIISGDKDGRRIWGCQGEKQTSLPFASSRQRGGRYKALRAAAAHRTHRSWFQPTHSLIPLALYLPV